MKPRVSWFRGFVVSCVVLAAVPVAAQGTAAKCSQLTTLKLPDIRITDATAVTPTGTGAVRAPHCRVNGVIGTEIKF